jgi:hypothetical protein
MTDRTGRLYTGQGENGYFETLTPEEKSKLAYIFDHNTSFVLEEGKVINLDDPYDRDTWKWLQLSPYLALDKAKGASNRDAAFYIVNVQKEANAYVDRTAKIDEARPAVRKLSQTDHVRIAAALGLAGAETFTPEQLLMWLLRKCDSDPEVVLSAINPQNSARVSATIFFKNAVKWGVIERSGKDGLFYFGGEQGVSIGHSDDMVVDYLLNPENAERARAMKVMLAEKTKAAVGITD